MCAGPDGCGTPGKNHYPGIYIGGDVVGGETYDLSNPDVMIRIAGSEDHVCRVTCNRETVVGLLEGRNPVLYEMCQKSR